MNGVVGKSKISQKRQVSIPKAVCLFLKLGAGDFVEWKIEDGKVYVEGKHGKD